MGEVVQSKAKKMLAVFILVSLVAVSFYQLYYPYGITPATQGANSENRGGLAESQQSSASDPSGPLISLNGTATGTATGQHVSMTASVKNITTYLPAGWKSSYIQTVVYSLWDQKNWANNGNFTANANGWSFSSRDVGSTNTFSSGWASSGVGGNPGYVYGRINGYSSGGSYGYDAGDRMSWNQTVSVPRGTILSASIEFKYYCSAGAHNLDAEVYAWVGSGRVDGVAWVNIPDPLAGWSTHSVSWPVNLSKITLPNVLVSVGHRQLVTMTYGGIGSYAQVYFDEVRLIIRAYVKPSQIQLKMQRGTTIWDVSTLNYGSGTITSTTYTIGPPMVQTAYPFMFTSNVSLPALSEFDANMTTKPTLYTSTQSFFQNNGSKVDWSMNHTTPFDVATPMVGITAFRNYYFNISVPADWNYTTCVDPDGKTHSIMSESNNFTVSIIGSHKILTVNVTHIGSYSSMLNSYGKYRIRAQSINYVRSIAVLRQSGATWVTVTNFYPTQVARFSAYISSGSVPVTTGLANLTLRGPATYGASPTVVYTNTSRAPDIYGYVNFTFTLTGSFAAGNYTGQVDWLDNTLGEAGSLISYFNITHTFNLSIVIPGEGDVVNRPKLMTNPPATVSVLDTYTGEFVTANVYGRVKWETPGRWDQFTTYSVQNATYTNQTNVPGSLGLGLYWFAVNATKPFYDKATANNTFWIGTQTHVSPESKSISMFYTENQTFSLNLDSILYQDENLTGIPDATIELLAGASSNNSLVRWDIRFTEDYSSSGTGHYSGSIGVGTYLLARGVPPGETYSVLFKLSKGTLYETNYYTLRLTVNPAPSYLTLLSIDNDHPFWGATAQIKLSFKTYWISPPATIPILNSTSPLPYAPPYVRVFTDWNGTWTATHLLFDSPGVYTFYVDTSSWTHPTETGSLATINVFFMKNSTSSHPEYSSSNIVAINLYVKSLATSVAGIGLSPSNATSAYSRDAKTIYVWYNDTHTGGSVGVGGANLAYTFKSSLGTFLGSGSLTAHPSIQGQYNLTLSSGLMDQTPGTYYLYVGAWKDPYYVHHNVTVTLVINAIPTALYGFTIVRGLTQSGSEVTLTTGDTFTVYMWYNDTHNGGVVLGSTTVMYYSTKFGFGYATPVSGVPGEYSVSFTASEAGDWLITFNATASKYALSTLPIRVIVNSPPSFSLAQVLLVGLGGGGIVVVGVVGWLLMRRRRIPFLIKKIDETLKIITKGEHEKASAVPLRSREEAVVGITQDRIDAFAKRKPLPGAPEEKAKEAPKGPEVEAALKTELAQVEGKEEPEEGIEEVEMDTLDQELGRIEGVEDKENLPDGAKEVRDVIEKYKEGKKKKK